MNKVIKKIVFEALAYDNLDQMEKYIDEGTGLQSLPVQPLYLALRKLPLEKVTLALEKMSQEQREMIMDLELWQKDAIDIENFDSWPLVYARSQNDNLRLEFAKSPQFHFYLKSKFNIWTFDVEDPVYPDHDNYFLTEDGLLLFEFSEDAVNIDEIQMLIRQLYADCGVEKAYTLLFKLVSESYLQLEEEGYQEKKSRLTDYGLVDYYDALEYQNIFPSIGHIEQFIRNKKVETAKIDTVLGAQGLHHNSVLAFREGLDNLEQELEKVEDSKRRDFLHFNFLRLVNGTISLDGALREGVVRMTKTGKKTKNLMLLGFDFIKEFLETENTIERNLFFEYFNFQDLYKVGLTLIKTEQKKLIKNLSYFIKNPNAQTFLGNIWTDFLDSALDETPSLKFDNLDKSISDVKTYKDFVVKSETLNLLSPFIKEFYKTFGSLKEKGKLQDYFYLNYNVDDIDFESILLTSFYNYSLKETHGSEEKKMGITINEFKEVSARYFNSTGEFINIDMLEIEIKNFSKTYGMEEIIYLNDYLSVLLREEVEGYQFETLDDEEFKYIGGPIILA